MRARKVDANQNAIVDLFRDLGAKVAITSAIGDGFPDLVVQHRHPLRGLQTHLVEIKDGSRPPSARRLTREQEVFHSIFVCHIVECDADVFELLEIRQGGA